MSCAGMGANVPVTTMVCFSGATFRCGQAEGGFGCAGVSGPLATAGCGRAQVVLFAVSAV